MIVSGDVSGPMRTLGRLLERSRSGIPAASTDAEKSAAATLNAQLTELNDGQRKDVWASAAIWELRVYTALPKATPATTADTTEWRSRTDIVDKNGKVTIRYAGQIRHLGIGRPHTGTPVLMLIHDRDVTVSNMNTGQIIAEFTIDPTQEPVTHPVNDDPTEAPRVRWRLSTHGG